METPSAQLREESLRGPTSLKTASVIAVIREKLVDFTEASWQTPKKAAEVRQDDMYDSLSSRLAEGRFGSYHRPFYQKHTNNTLLVSRLSRPDHSLIMICGEDDEDASDKNTALVPLDLNWEQGQRSRSVYRYLNTSETVARIVSSWWWTIYFVP